MYIVPFLIQIYNLYLRNYRFIYLESHNHLYIDYKIFNFIGLLLQDLEI